MRRRKVRFIDIAEAARVGIATVDRVLNERGPVSPQTADLVLGAARRLGLNRALPERYQRRLRFEALVYRPDTFLDPDTDERAVQRRMDTGVWPRLERALIQAGIRYQGELILNRTFMDSYEPEEYATRIRLAARRNDGLILMAPENALVRKSIDVAVEEFGIPIVAVVNDIMPSRRSAFVGIDNRRVGRSAAYFISGFMERPGGIIISAGRLSYRGNRERVRACVDRLGQLAPGVSDAVIVEGLDDFELTRSVVLDALVGNPGTTGIYSAGGFNRAIARAIGQARPAHRVVFIGHELTDGSRSLLRKGRMDLIFDQNPEVQTDRAIQLLIGVEY